MGVLLHGDATFDGQGVVYAAMGFHFHSLPYYGVNNHIGFTTDPRVARSTPYPSDIVMAIDTLIFHVNGDNVEAIKFACQLVEDWRAKCEDVVSNSIVCYLRYGHNEMGHLHMSPAIAKQPVPLT